MKKFGIAVLGIFAAVLLAGCNSGLNGDQSVEYGSLTMNLASDSRYLDVSEISKATVNVWYNKSEKVSKPDVSVSAGKGSVTIENIPAGSNRVVEVIGYKATGVEGKRLYYVTNITGGNTNSISSIKDGKDSAKGKAYLALLNAGVSVSGVSLDGFDAEKSAYYFDADSFAQAYKSDESVSPSSYYTAAKTVTLSSIVNAAGYTVWIGDPLSEKLSITSNSTTTDTIENVAPGTWTVYANNGSTVKSVGTVTVAGSNVSFDKTIGSPYNGHMVVYVSAESAPRLWIWQVSGSYTDGSTVLGCEWNSRPTMAAADGMYDNAGWYMYDLTANGCNYTDGIAFNIKLNEDENVITGKTATFWYDAKGLCGTEEEFYDSDPTEGKLSSDATLASISVNGTVLTGFASGTTNYSTSVATTVTSATVTAVANYSAATVVVSPSGSTDLTEGVAKTFTITVTAEDGTTTKTYTVNVTRATANDTTLSSITVNGKSATISGTTATANITGSEDSLSITSIVATAVDSSATITYSATTGTVADGASKNFTITVTNGSKTATYTLTVNYTMQTTPEYYWTNKNGAVGNNKTITGISSWTEEDKIIQGVACDTPRCWLGGHEYPDPDLYAMFAAWDDTNLYLLIEIPNVDDADAVDNDKCYAGSQFLPMGIVLNTGKRTAGNGLLDTGNSVWQGSALYTWEEGIDTMLMFHPRLGIGEPSIFKTQSDGTFTYESSVTVAANKQYCIGFATAGVEREIFFNKCVSSNMWAAVTDEDGNWGSKSSTDMDSYSYVDYMSSEYGKKMSSYQVTIPLSALDIDKNYIENTGISVGCFSTYGASTMDCLPWDSCMIDNAAESYSSDSSSSKEKEDADNITVSLARIGK